MPISALRSAFPVLGNPANRHRAVPLTYDQFRYAFANAVSEDEAKQPSDSYACRRRGRASSVSIQQVGWVGQTAGAMLRLTRNRLCGS